MSYSAVQIGFAPGIYANRSRLSSKARFVDGNLVRFPDGVPAQMGGWVEANVGGDDLVGLPRAMLGWRPNALNARYAVIGTHSAAFRYNGVQLIDITPEDIAPGRASGVIGPGYGTGPYGAEAYGTPRTLQAPNIEATTWTFDMFGEVLLGCFTADGTIYEYLAGTDTKLIEVDNAPKANAICVSDERHVFAFGCDGNPNLVRWSDRENRKMWAPAATNRAGSYDMQATSQFQCGHRVAGEVLAWTLTELFAFSPLSNALVYSQRRLGSACGTLGPHSVAVASDPFGGRAFWMGPTGFFYFDGIIRQLDCDLQDFVFKDINLTQRRKAHARTNTAFGEIWFFYCSAASSEIDRAVVFDYRTRVWTKAAISRLAWLDAGIFNKPLALDATGTLYQHETGASADGEPLDSYILTSPLTIGAGDQFAQVASFWPDLEAGSGTCSFTAIARDYAGAAPMEFGPYEFSVATEKLDLAISAREVQVRIGGVSGPWEWGAPSLNLQGGGLRG